MILAGADKLLGLTVGPSVMMLLFGPKYEAGTSLIPWLSLMIATRTLRIQPSLLTPTTSHPKCELSANMARSIAIPLAIISISASYGVESVAKAVLAGEVIALMIGWQTLKSNQFDVSFWRSMRLMSGLFVGLVILAIVFTGTTVSNAIVCASGLLFVCILFVICILFCEQLRTILSTLRSSFTHAY